MPPARYSLFLGLAISSLAAACLNCFSTTDQRLRVCQYFLGHESKQHLACLDALKKAFQPYVKTFVGVSEMEKLKATFARIIFYLEEKGMAKVPYHQAIPKAAEQVQKELAELPTAQVCIPPCGFQKEARQYKCDSCRIMDCQYPIDCPVQEVHKHEGDVTLLSCEVKFQIPTDRLISWKFAQDIRTQDLSLFQEVSLGGNPSFLIRPTQRSHHGTYVCQVSQRDDVLIRKYFYLNVTTPQLGKEKELQEMFQAILQPPSPGSGLEEVKHNVPSLQELLAEPDSLRKKSVIFLIVGLVLSSMLVTLTLMALYYWATDIHEA